MNKKLKITAWVSVLFLILLLLPVFYLSFVNRASGDDYNYAAGARAAWMTTHSLAEVCRAACQTVSSYYYSWQGTWFSIFVFALQPEVFHDDAYVIVAFLMLFLWIGSTFYLCRQILYKNMKFTKWNYILIATCISVISVEFVPSPKSSIFWFNGCAHYMLPFSMCQIAAVWLFRYCEEYKIRYFIGITIFMTLLGGSNYQAALFILIIACYIGIAVWFLKKDKRILTLLFPVGAELAGLVVSMKAPGNKVRAGDDFGFSVLKGIETIGSSFLYGIKDIGQYLRERTIVFAGLLFIFMLFLVIFGTMENPFRFKHPVWLSLMLFCLYSAMQAPAIYAGVDVSRGVLNTNFQMFVLTISGILMIAAESLSRIIRGRWKKIVIPGALLCLILVFIGRSSIKLSTTYVSLRYIASGEAADYKEQMDLQTKLMEEEGVEDVIVPFINDEQGPLMHMPVTSDPGSFTSWATAQFYGKKSVVAIERAKWMELYGGLD